DPHRRTVRPGRRGRARRLGAGDLRDAPQPEPPLRINECELPGREALMKPAPFDYFAPATLDEALGLLAEHGGDAKPLAGGPSLIPAMNFRLARPAVLVDLNRISELAYVRAESGVAIGAMPQQRVVGRAGGV